MAEDQKLMEVCKTILGTSQLMFYDLHGHLASGDLDTARDDLAGIKVGIEIAKELKCPYETVEKLKTMHREGHDTYSGMLTSKVEALIRRTSVSGHKSNPSNPSNPHHYTLVYDTQVVARDLPTPEIAKAYAQRRGLPLEKCLIY